MKKIKVMHFIHGMSPGGAEILVKDYLKYLDKKRFDLVLLCLYHFRSSPYEKIVEGMGIRVIYVEDYLRLKSSNHFAKIINYIKRYLVVRSVIRSEKPDVIHGHLCVNTYIKFSRPSKDTFIVHTVHSEPKCLWRKSRSLQQIFRRQDFKGAKYLVKKYGMRFIVLHDRMRKEINKMFSVSDSVVLNNGVDISRFNKAESIEEIRKKLGIRRDAFVIGHIGRFHKEKNHSFLIDIFKEIKKTEERAFLLMVGDGGGKATIKKYLDENGFEDDYLILSNRNDIPGILKAMNVFVFPSLFEGLGVALVEAQVAKIPCFVSDGIPRHAIISNQTKQLTLKLGPQEWAKEILGFKKPKNIIVDDSEWDIRKITKQLEKIYLEGIEKKSNEKR